MKRVLALVFCILFLALIATAVWLVYHLDMSSLIG